MPDAFVQPPQCLYCLDAMLSVQGVAALAASRPPRIAHLNEQLTKQHTGAAWLQIEQDLETVANSEHFFLFEESLRAVLLAVSRDPELGPSCCHKPFPMLLGTAAAGTTQGHYPPSGLLPCR